MLLVTGFALATLNALLNSTAALLMVLGVVAIKRKQTTRHKRFMIAAFVASCLFLTSYLTRIFLFGDTRFGGQGALRVFYLTLLVSHVLLAMAVAPMVLTTLWLGLRSNYARHRNIARFTFPVWAYVSVTGVLVYLLLYHLPH
jgi:putative membrane protein